MSVYTPSSLVSVTMSTNNLLDATTSGKTDPKGFVPRWWINSEAERWSSQTACGARGQSQLCNGDHYEEPPQQPSRLLQTMGRSHQCSPHSALHLPLHATLVLGASAPSLDLAWQHSWCWGGLTSSPAIVVCPFAHCTYAVSHSVLPLVQVPFAQHPPSLGRHIEELRCNLGHQVGAIPCVGNLG